MSNVRYSEMFKVACLIISLSVCGTSLATDLVPREWLLGLGVLAEHGFHVSIVDGLVCGDAHEVYVSIPETFNDAVFSSVGLQVGSNESPLVVASMIRFETSETINGIELFSGITFCLSDELIEVTTVSVTYAKGQFATDIVTLENFREATE